MCRFRRRGERIQILHLTIDNRVDDKRESDAHGYAEKSKKSIEQARYTSDVIFIGEVADAVGERHSRYKRNDGSYNHIAEMRANTKLIHHNAEEGSKQTSECIRHDTRKMMFPDKENEYPEKQTCNSCNKTIIESTAEDDTESRAAERRCHDLFPDGFGFHGTNVIETLFQLIYITATL